MNYLKVTNQISNLHGKRLKVHSFNCVPKSTLFHYYFFTLFLLYLYSLNSLTSYTPTLLTILTFLLLHFLYKQIIQYDTRKYKKGELTQNCPNIQSKWSIQVPTRKKTAKMDNTLNTIGRRTILTMRYGEWRCLEFRFNR
jgi:hypothetical protein